MKLPSLLLLACACAGLGAAATLRAAPPEGGDGRTEPADVVAAPAWDLTRPAPLAGALTERLEDLEGLACAECHADVVAEWSESLHALAWVDELFQDDIDRMRKPQSCYGCHVPEPLIGAGVPRKPAARAGDFHLGVDCATCHLGPDGETVHGPWGLENDAHPSVRDERFADAAAGELCIACHATNIGPVIGIAKDFESSGGAARGRMCVACHMAPVERELSTPGPDGKPLRRAGRSHALQTPRDPSFLRRAFGITARAQSARTLLRFENLAGHRVPGLIGRRFRFRVEVLEDGGRTLASARLELDHRSPLPVDGAREVAIDAIGPTVRVTGQHFDPRLEDPVVFLELDLALD